MRIRLKLTGRSLRTVLVILPLLVTLIGLLVTSTTSAQTNSGGLGIGRGDGQEVGINLAALNQLRADAAAGIYNRPCTAQEHNRTQWHTLVNPVAKCHYDHQHGDDPNYINDIFGEPGAWFGVPGQSISYPWQTFPAASMNEQNDQYVASGRMENDMKHEGYIWVVRRDQQCPNGFCITDFRLETHAIFGAHDIPVRFHSYSFEARVCGDASNPTTCGIFRTGGWVDTGKLFTTNPDDLGCGFGQIMVRLRIPADTLYFPLDENSADEMRCHPMINNALPSYPSQQPVVEWWEHNPGDRVRFQLRSFDPIGNVNPTNLTQWDFYCEPTDMNCHYDQSITTAWIGYLIKALGGYDRSIGDYIYLDRDGDGIGNHRGYTNRGGDNNNGPCSQPALDCVPVEYTNLYLDPFFRQFGEGTFVHTICDQCPKVDHDISPAGQRWNIWFYRYMDMNMGTPTPVPTSAPGVTPPAPPSPTPSPAPSGPAVVVDVNPTSADPGLHVGVALKLVNVSNVYGLQSECVVNPAILSGADVVGGDGFNDSNSFFVNSGYDASDGSWLIAASRLQPNPAISVSLTAYTLNYIAQGPGVTEVTCAVLAVDSSGHEIPLQVINGSFGSGQPPAPTQPPSATPVPTGVPTEMVTLVPPSETPETGPLAHIQGTVAFQNAPDHAGIAVALLANDVEVTAVVTGPDGAFDFSDVAPGAYVVQATGPEHLVTRIAVTVDASGQTVNLGTTTLVAGDTDDNGTVDIVDATFVGANFDVDVPPAPSNADMNHDALVNVSDLVLVGGNFGQTGPINGN